MTSQSCELFLTDLPALIAALLSPEMVSRYAQALDAELADIIEPPLRRFNRRQRSQVDELNRLGADRLRQQEPSLFDELVTDMFALATWHGWSLPVDFLGHEPCRMTEQAQGLLGHEISGDGASVFRFPDQRIALVRQRIAGVDIDHPCHPPS